MRVLKRGALRTVYVDAEGSVVKRFHHPGRLGALLDRRRAEAERRILEALHARGIDVPRPLALRRSEDGWELQMEHIAEATDLARVLADGDGTSPPLVDLAQRVGALLARAHAAGLDHPDLHPGNVLVDRAGRPWLVDFHHARMRRRDAWALGRRDLTALCAYVRETLEPRGRAALLGGWLAERGAAAPEGLLAELEARARELRRAWAERSARGRWTRTSSVCEEHALPTGPALARRGLLRPQVEALVGRSPTETGTPASVIEHAGLAAVRVGAVGRVRAALWRAAARLAEHGVPCPRPLAFGPGGVAFELGAGARRARVEDAPAACAALLGALHDRGLDVGPLGPEVWLAGRTALLDPPRELRAIDPRPGRLAPRARFRAAPWIASEPALRRVYAAAFRGPREETEALERELVV